MQVFLASILEKNLGAYGDGGAIVTNNEEIVKSRMIANHGRIEKYDHEFEGRNSRLDGLQAAILSVKLKHLDNWIDKRLKIANYYIEHLKDITGLVLPKKKVGQNRCTTFFVIRVKKETSFNNILKKILFKQVFIILFLFQN